MWTKIDDERLGEAYLTMRHPSGMTVCLNKKARASGYAVLGVRYGGGDFRYLDAEGKLREHPVGTAHFLEHKMFENADGTDSMQTFASLGLYSNAYTSRDCTCYLFGGSGDVHAGVRELIRFVMHPYYTDKTVQKEMGIIGEEIASALDDPTDRLYDAGIRGLFDPANPLCEEVLGSRESIAKITPDVLYEAHRIFYNPANTVLVLSGDYDEYRVEEILNEELPSVAEPLAFSRYFFEEGDRVNQARNAWSLGLNESKFFVGLKRAFTDDTVKTRRFLAAADLLATYFSDATPKIDKMTDKNLLLSDFSVGVGTAKNQFYAYLYATSQNANEAIAMLGETARDLYAGLDENFLRSAVKNRIAATLFASESTEGWCQEAVGDMLDGVPPFSALADYAAVGVEDLKETLAYLTEPSHVTVTVAR